MLTVSCLQFVQRRDSTYWENREKTVWSMDQLNDYINNNYMQEKNLERDWVYSSLVVCTVVLRCISS